jgi:hypothetical protein
LQPPRVHDCSGIKPSPHNIVSGRLNRFNFIVTSNNAFRKQETRHKVDVVTGRSHRDSQTHGSPFAVVCVCVIDPDFQRLFNSHTICIVTRRDPPAEPAHRNPATLRPQEGT